MPSHPRNVVFKIVSAISLELADGVDVHPGKAFATAGLGTWRSTHKSQFAQRAEGQFATGDFFSSYRYLQGAQLTVGEKTPLKIEHKGCSACSRSGKASCTSCGGAGTTACPACNASGSVKSHQTVEQKAWRIRCSCDNGWVKFANRDGAIISNPCGACAGKGFIEHGTDRTFTRTSNHACSRCKGARHVRCSQCSGGHAGVCTTCQGKKVITEVYHASLVAKVREHIQAPRWLKRYHGAIADTVRTNPTMVARAGHEKRRDAYYAAVEVDLTLAPHQVRQQDGSTAVVDPWMVVDLNSGQRWQQRPSVGEKLGGMIGLGPRPPFSLPEGS